ncbi:MAG: polysaccharide deacetylase family protein [Candidatus Sulfotelmatobacter sp.]
MNLRHQARSFLMQGANLTGADALALIMQKNLRHSRAVVVAMHETPPSMEAQFRQQLEFASKHFTITSLEAFAKLWEQDSESDAVSKPLLLFTFDDGRESNYVVAAPLLEAFGGRGVFFIVPAFAEQAGTEKALAFYQTKMNPDSKPGDEEVEDLKPMSPVQIADLANRGHAIGSHTLTHARLIGLTPETLEREIGESARQLMAWTKKPVDAFAWTFGWDVIDVHAWRTIQKYHRYCFAPCAGAIHPDREHPSLLWRREIETRYTKAEYQFCYSGLVDLWWRNRRAQLRDRLRGTSAGKSKSLFVE